MGALDRPVRGVRHPPADPIELGNAVSNVARAVCSAQPSRGLDRADQR
jgi:hypothetical protein